MEEGTDCRQWTVSTGHTQAPPVWEQMVNRPCGPSHRLASLPLRDSNALYLHPLLRCRRVPGLPSCALVCALAPLPAPKPCAEHWRTPEDSHGAALMRHFKAP